MRLSTLLAENMAWLFSRKTLYLRWLVIFGLPFALFIMIFTASGEIVRQALDEKQPQQKIAFIASPAADDLKAELSKNKNYVIMPDLAPLTWAAAMKTDTLHYVLETSGDSTGLRNVFVWYNGDKTSGAARLKESIYRYQIRKSGLPSFGVDSDDARGLGEKMKGIVDIIVVSIATLLGLLLILFTVWSGRHIAIHAFTLAPRKGAWAKDFAAGATLGKLHWSGFLAVWLSTYIGVWLLLGGVYASMLRTYNDDAAIILRALQTFLNTKSLLAIGLHALPISVLFAAIWTKLNSGSDGSAYRAMRRGNAMYVFIFVGSALAIIANILKMDFLQYIPIFNTWVVVADILNSSSNMTHLSIFWASNSLLAAWFLWSSRADCFLLAKHYHDIKDK
jgi:hypothetical protein